MSLEPKVSVASSKSTGIKVYDSTGVYNASTNPGGYGAPNEDSGDITAILVQMAVIGETLPAATAFSAGERGDYISPIPVTIGTPTFADGVYDIRTLIGFAGPATVSASAGSKQFQLTSASTVFLVAVGFTIDSLDPEKLYRIDRTKVLNGTGGYVTDALPAATNLNVTIYYEAQKYALVYDQGEACLLEDISKLGCGCNSEETLKLTERYARYLSMLQRFTREEDYQGAHKLALQLHNDCDPQCLPCGTSGRNTGSSSSSSTCVPPTISTQPSDVNTTLGANAAFTVVAAGSPKLYYQWKKNGIDIAGATGATLNLLNIQNSDTASYTCKVWNACGQVTSDAADLTVSSELTPVTILTHPQNQTVAPGATVVFSVVAAGSPTITYQWRKDGVNLNGETGSTLTLAAVDAGDEADYDCVVTNPVNSVVSNAGTLTLGEVALWGWMDTLPVDENDVLNLQASGPFTPGGTITADFRANEEPKYLIMAEPATEPQKTTWYATPLNNGIIPNSGGPVDGLFYVLDTYGSWRVYVSAYPTYNTENVIEFRV